MEPEAKSKATTAESETTQILMERIQELANEVAVQANALESWAEDLLTCYPDREHAHLYVFPQLISEKLASLSDQLCNVKHALDEDLGRAP